MLGARDKSAPLFFRFRQHFFPALRAVSLSLLDESVGAPQRLGFFRRRLGRRGGELLRRLLGILHSFGYFLAPFVEQFKYRLEKKSLQKPEQEQEVGGLKRQELPFNAKHAENLLHTSLRPALR